MPGHDHSTWFVRVKSYQFRTLCVAWRQTSSKVIKETILLVTIYPWPRLFWNKKQCFALSLLEVVNVKVRGQSQHFSSPTTWENLFFRLAILQEIIRKVCEFSFEGVLPTYNVSDVVLSQQVVCWNHRGANILVLWELPNYQKKQKPSRSRLCMIQTACSSECFVLFVLCAFSSKGHTHKERLADLPAFHVRRSFFLLPV